jgi:hypothetical protein
LSNSGDIYIGLPQKVLLTSKLNSNLDKPMSAGIPTGTLLNGGFTELSEK